MSEERTCPIYYETMMYKKPPCGGKILRKEQILSSEEVIGDLYGPKELEGGYTEEEKVLYYIYECENGHALVRPDWWADVPIVPTGTIVIHGSKEHPEWYKEGNRGITNKPPGYSYLKKIGD